MSDPRRPYEPEPQWSQPTESMGNPYQSADPAYAGQYSYPSYIPPGSANPTEQLPQYWTQTQYPQYQPAAAPPPPPGPPRSPRWLWLVAGGVVVLVVGLVVALVIANGSKREETAVSPLPGLPETSTPPPTRVPTTIPQPSFTQLPEPPVIPTIPPIPLPVPPSTSDGAATESVQYTVSGEGRAISITYIDTGGMLQMEFNVVLPWSREVALSPSTAKGASVTIINVGREVDCTISLNGAQVDKRSGSGLTVCSAAR